MMRGLHSAGRRTSNPPEGTQELMKDSKRTLSVALHDGRDRGRLVFMKAGGRPGANL